MIEGISAITLFYGLFSAELVTFAQKRAPFFGNHSVTRGSAEDRRE